MKYKKLLETYESYLDLIEKMKKKRPMTSEYWDGFRTGLTKMYWSLLEETEFEPKTEEPTELERKELVDPETNKEPYAMLVYRRQRVPLYVSDDGKHEYMIYRGTTYKDEASNDMIQWDFCCVIDNYLSEDISKEQT